jgi:hypothetical protein
MPPAGCLSAPGCAKSVILLSLIDSKFNPTRGRLGWTPLVDLYQSFRFSPLKNEKISA